MEKVSIEAIERFLSKHSGYGSGDGNGYGYGSGDGNGYGYGNGYGNGNGDGDGSGYGSGYGSGDGSGDGNGYGSGYGSGDGSGDGNGYGYGSGDGSGYGNGYGDGVKEINGQRVYNVDGVPTIFESIHGNYAKGYILNSDLTLKPCWVAKYEDYFAHGYTLREAQADSHTKALREMSTEERLDAFMEAHPDTKHRYPAADLFEWHGILTGSCNMGRRHFCDERNINVKTDTFTVEEFVQLTKNDFGGDIIKKISYK